jgi:hypothetical protein
MFADPDISVSPVTLRATAGAVLLIPTRLFTESTNNTEVSNVTLPAPNEILLTVLLDVAAISPFDIEELPSTVRVVLSVVAPPIFAVEDTLM